MPQAEPRKDRPRSSATSLLERQQFTTSLSLDFFTESGLATQIGYPRDSWPIVLLKELVDNALDACEKDGISPEIRVVIERDAMSVQDNGSGLPQHVLDRSLDPDVRISDKCYFASPTRGQLGNGLKCVWAAPLVANGTRCQVEVVTHGERHVIDVTLDSISKLPRIDRCRDASIVKNGTLVKVHWPGIA
jgi:DNA topoisomerase VI subunit B